MSTTTSGAATPMSNASSKAGGEPKKKMRILMLHGELPTYLPQKPSDFSSVSFLDIYDGIWGPSHQLS